MKAARRFCPGVHSLEERVVLSFSFSKTLHSILPFIPDHTKVKALPTAAQIAAHDARLLAAQEARVTGTVTGHHVRAHAAPVVPAHPGALLQARLAARAARLAARK